MRRGNVLMLVMRVKGVVLGLEIMMMGGVAGEGMFHSSGNFHHLLYAFDVDPTVNHTGNACATKNQD